MKHVLVRREELTTESIDDELNRFFTTNQIYILLCTHMSMHLNQGQNPGYVDVLKVAKEFTPGKYDILCSIEK